MPPRGRNGRRRRPVGGHRGGGGGGGGDGGQRGGMIWVPVGGGGGGGGGGNGGQGGGHGGNGGQGVGRGGGGGVHGGDGGGAGGGAFQAGGGAGIAPNMQANQAALNRLRVLAIEKKTAEAFVDQVKKGYRSPIQQHSVDDLDVLVTTCAFSAESLVAHCTARKQYNASHCFYHIPVELPDGVIETVPVAQEKEPSTEERRHLIVELRRDADRARCRVLIGEKSGYSVAFQFLNDQEPDPDSVPWFLFKESDDLPRRFKIQIRIKYSIHYNHLEDVNIEGDTGGRVFSFLGTFPRNWNQEPTTEGYIMFATLFIALNEGPRFDLIEHWLSILGRLPPEFARLVRSWSKLSDMIYLLLLYLAEVRLHEQTGNAELADIATITAERTRNRWARMQWRLQALDMGIFPRIKELDDQHIEFEHGGLLEDEVLDETLLRRVTCGRGLNMLCYNSKLVNQIRMREAGYSGPFSES